MRARIVACLVVGKCAAVVAVAFILVAMIFAGGAGCGHGVDGVCMSCRFAAMATDSCRRTPGCYPMGANNGGLSTAWTKKARVLRSRCCAACL